MGQREHAVMISFLEQIDGSEAMPTDATARDVAHAVFCILSQRLTAGEARKLAESLPPGLANLIEPCAEFRTEEPQRFGRGEFLDRLSDHLEISVEQADELARDVFRAIHDHLLAAPLEDVEGQLPLDMKDYWRSGTEEQSGLTED